MTADSSNSLLNAGSEKPALEIDVIGGPQNGSLLGGIRSVLHGAESALLCVAFANRTGVALLQPELKKLGNKSRLLLTTAFGSSTQAALSALEDLKCQVRVLNPRSGTFHPKVYVARHGSRIRAAIGSANLTSGLVKNIEVMTLLSGLQDWLPIRKVTDLTEELWNAPAVIPFSEALEMAPNEVLEEPFLGALKRVLPTNRPIHTLAERKENWIVDVSPAGVLVETQRSKSNNTGPQMVEAWMLQLAWDYLTAHGEITNTTLLNELHVHRSAAVCAILARLPSVEIVSSRPIRLRLRNSSNPLKKPQLN